MATTNETLRDDDMLTLAADTIERARQEKRELGPLGHEELVALAADAIERARQGHAADRLLAHRTPSWFRHLTGRNAESTRPLRRVTPRDRDTSAQRPSARR